MAESNCTVNGSCDYNGGWDSSYGWEGGYAHSSNKCTVYKFTTGSFSGTHSNTVSSLSGTVKIRTAGNTAGKGVVVMKIFSSDPRGGSFPTLTGGDRTTVSWSRGGAGWDNFSYSISSPSLSANTTYYMVVGYSSGNNAELSGGGAFSAKVTYTYINAISKPSAPSAPTNHHNNTFSASCSAVSNPGNNPVTTTIQYKFGSGSWIDAGSRSISGKPHTAEAAADSQTVYVRVKAQPTYGSDANKDGIADPVYSDSSTGTTLKNYVPPTIPSVAPSVTKSKTRFTVKEPWVVSWTGEGQTSTPVNNSSSVAGYRVVLQVKKASESEFKSVPIKNINGATISKNPSSPTWHTIDTKDLGANSITIYPDKQEFAPGDQVKVGIRPYILWGAANPTHEKSHSNTNKLFNETENKYKYTAEITVQNAGVVRVKTGTDKSSFKEGIVWVKIDDSDTNANNWVEADVVKVKTEYGWKESE